MGDFPKWTLGKNSQIILCFFLRGSLTWQCVVDVGIPAILQTITTTDAVSTTVKPKLRRNFVENTEENLQRIGYQSENHLGVILLILDPIVSITLLPQQTIPIRNRSYNLYKLELGSCLFLGNIWKKKKQKSESF